MGIRMERCLNNNQNWVHFHLAKTQHLPARQQGLQGPRPSSTPSKAQGKCSDTGAIYPEDVVE